jgi:hypothetical protein
MMRRPKASIPALGSSRNKHLGIVLQREREREALLLAARHLRDLTVELPVEADPLGHLGGPRRDPVVGGVELEDLAGVGFFGQRGRLKLHADPRPQRGQIARQRRIEVEDANRPGRRPTEADAALERRGLARPVATQQSEDGRRRHEQS